MKGFVAECKRVNVFTPSSIVTYTDDSIFFNQPCAEVDQKLSFAMNVMFTPEMTAFSFAMSDLLVDSEVLNPDDKGRCRIAVFSTEGMTVKSPNTFYLGQLYLQKYYTFFDISGMQDKKTENLVVGTGLKHPDAQVL